MGLLGLLRGRRLGAKSIADLRKVIECGLYAHNGSDADQFAIALAWEQNFAASGQTAALVPPLMKLDLECSLGAASKAFPRLHVAWLLALARCGIQCPASSLPESVLVAYDDGSDYEMYLMAVLDTHAACGTLVVGVLRASVPALGASVPALRASIAGPKFDCPPRSACSSQKLTRGTPVFYVGSSSSQCDFYVGWSVGGPHCWLLQWRSRAVSPLALC